MDKNITDEKNQASYGVSSELVSVITKALKEHNTAVLHSKLSNLHAADLADLFENIAQENRESLVEFLRPSFNPEIFNHLDDSVREELIEYIGTQDLGVSLAQLDSEDALAIVEDLEEEQQKEVLRILSDEDRFILEEVLGYPEDSAGRLMQREVLAVPPFWSVSQVLKYIKDNKDHDDAFYSIYVVNPKHQPIGIIPLSSLLRAEDSSSIKKVMEIDIHKVPLDLSQEEVARLFHHYGLVSAPVIDSAGRLVGVINVDDVVDVIEEKATEDIMQLAGVGETDFHASAPETFLSRSRWLFVTLVSAFMSSWVIHSFKDTIEHIVALAILMPICTAMGGNAGLQVMTVIVRSLATRDLREGNFLRTLIKELTIGLMNGGLFAALIAIIVIVFFGNWGLAMILASALLFNMIWAAFAGTLLPVVINRMGLDPALSAGPLLVTTTDVLGFLAFLGLASMFLV